MLHVLAYDIESDSRRNRVAKLLLDYGDRVQYSVFEAELSPPELQEILRRVGKLLGENDRFHAYPLCATCRSRITVLGSRGPEPNSSLCMV